MLGPIDPRPSIALWGALAMLAPGCGQGLFSHYRIDASGTADTVDEKLAPGFDTGPGVVPEAGPEKEPDGAPDASPDAGPDTGSGDGSDAAGDVTNDVVSQLVDVNGADLYLEGAHLSIGPGSFRVPTLVTMRFIPSIDHSGAYGPVFEISVPSPSKFLQDPVLTLPVPDIGANQPSLVLGSLDPSLSLDAQQWIPVQGSGLSSDQKSVSGPANGLRDTSDLLFGAVVRCPPVTACPSGQTCNSGACQQCPTSSPCP